MLVVVHVRAPKQRVLQALRSVPSAVRQGGTADAVLASAGTAVLGRVARAFLVKSTGGTDEAGERWVPLSPVTVLKRLRKRMPTGDRKRPSSALNDQQRRRWWDYYRRALWRFKDKSIAARVAWSRLKREGGVSLFDKYGAANVDILHDTGQLLRSLRPDTHSPHKVFRVLPGAVELGTDRKGAAAHHSGVFGKLPQRRLWPHPRKWPPEWWRAVLSGTCNSLAQFIAERVKSA